MKRSIFRTLGLACGLLGAVSAMAADWDFECIDPDPNNDPYSDDLFVTWLNGSSLMTIALGIAGTVGYGDTGAEESGGDNDIPCYPDVVAMPVAGAFSFSTGSQGSVQDTNPADPNAGGFTDDFMPFTFGGPTSPAPSSCYMGSIVDGTRTRFGSNGINLLFTGLSNRYFRCESTDGDFNIQLTASVVGDAAQMSWLFTNTSPDTAHELGMWFGMGLAILSDGADVNGANASHFFTNTPPNTAQIKEGYVLLSTGGRPPITEHRYRRAINPGGFPDVVDFVFGQTSPFGLRIENAPSSATTSTNGVSDAAEAEEFVLGQQFFLLGPVEAVNNFPDVIFPPIDPNDPDLGSDVPFRDNSAFIQKFPTANVAPGSSRRITHYIRQPWGNSNYTAPYGAVVDAPLLVAEDSTSLNGLRPNPMTIRVYVDNVGGYATVNQEIALNDVRITLTLGNGLALAAGENAVKTLNSVPARAIRFVDYQVEADGIEFGDLDYSVKIEPVPGPTKILNGKIRVASTPRLKIFDDANLVTAPWQFGDSSIEAVLQLQNPTDFQAFNWDPQQQGYVPATAFARGVGTWIVTTQDFGSIPLAGNPQRPPDTAEGGKVIQLKSGWNLIGNPYQYAIKVGEIVGVSAAAPEQSFPWSQLVAQGFVSGSLAYYDNELGDYVFTTNADSDLLPNRGYWVFVATVQDLTLSFGAVYAPGLPGSFRGVRGEEASRWVQSDRQWRLKLSARTSKSLDGENYVGQARNASEAARLRIMEPPMTPVHDVQIGISEVINGRETRLAQSLTERTGRKEWKMVAYSTKAGTVHLTWPNIGTIARNIQFRLTDLSTGTTRDMRRISGYQYEATSESTREFKIEAFPGGISSVVIGTIDVSRVGRAEDPRAPFAINYTLSNDATTTIRILSGTGKEVYSVARGRADKAGQNTATWNLKDNASRVVAPGTYRVEIIAETPTGERVRRVVPVNVIR